MKGRSRVLFPIYLMSAVSRAQRSPLLENAPSQSPNSVSVLIQFWWRQPHTARDTGRQSSKGRRFSRIQCLANASHQTTRNPRGVESLDPVHSGLLRNPFPHRRHHFAPALDPTGVGCKRFVARQIIELQNTHARPPLSIASYRENERSILGFEELVRHEIRMRVSPALRVSPTNEDILGDIR